MNDSEKKPEEKVEESVKPSSELKRKLEKKQNKLEAKRQRKEENAKSKEDTFFLNMPTKISFHVENGIRHLAPYWSAYTARTKGRWIGRTIVDVFQQEFLAYNPKYAVAALRLGRILLNGRQVTMLDQRLRDGDVIAHVHHRHEHSVLDRPIKIISDTENMLVVNKPSSMPVHACGQYKVNTILGLLWKLHGISGLRVLHRLDRVTSGVLMFSKNLETDVEIKELIKSGQWKKEYVCKVSGKFPDGKHVCEQKIDNLVVTIGIQQVRDDGKDCKSTFQRIWYDPTNDESLVLCQIESGRTHQIRVHLQFLGYPIINDNIYNSDVWGLGRGKDAEYGKPVEQLVEDLKEKHSCTNWQEYKDPEYDSYLQSIAENEEIQMEDWSADDYKFEERPEKDPICLFCHIKKRMAPAEHYEIPLHCWRYTSVKWSFTADLPGWAWPPPKDVEIVPNVVEVDQVAQAPMPELVAESC